MRAVGTDEVAHAQLVLAVLSPSRVAVTPSASCSKASRIPRWTSTPHGEFFAQDPLGAVLRNRDEPEGNVDGQGEVELRDLLTVDIDDLTVHLDRLVQDAAQHSHALEHLERTGLTPTAFAYCGGSYIGSTMRQPMPRRANSMAAVRPTSPLRR